MSTTETRTSAATPDTDVEVPVTVTRRPHTLRWVAISFGVVLALFVVLLATRKSAESGKADSPLLGQIAPEIAGPGLDGKTVALSSMRGEYVVVNFFASWCIPCQTEQPQLQQFATKHAAAGDARIFGVVYDDTPDRVREFLDREGGDWPVVDAPASKVDWGVRGVPESFIVDPDGYVISHIVGGVKAESLDQILQQAKSPRG